MEAALAEYARRLSPSETAPYSVLTRELRDYWRVLDPALGWDADERRMRSFAFLRDEVLPRRMAMVSIADQIARLNEQQLNDDNLQMADLFSQFRFRLTATIAVHALAGPALAALSMANILRLETGIAEEAQSRPQGSFRPPGAGAGK